MNNVTFQSSVKLEVTHKYRAEIGHENDAPSLTRDYKLEHNLPDCSSDVPQKEVGLYLAYCVSRS